MIYLPEHADLVCRGLKWQTRRLVRHGDNVAIKDGRVVAVHNYTQAGRPRLRWRVGNTYAVQPGRGKMSLCRRKLLEIRQEQLHDTTVDDAVAEGVPSRLSDELMMLARLGMLVGDGLAAANKHIEAFFEVWDRIHTKRGTRSADDPRVWVLTFERKGAEA